MKFLRKLFGLDFPDPQVGQVWRSRHSGRAFRVDRVQLSDDGTVWHVDKRHEVNGGFNTIGMSYSYYRYYPNQWRRMLREEGRTLVAGPGWVLAGEQVTR
jgi:hypothetical protein